jgi:putative ABC transport system permease protein
MFFTDFMDRLRRDLLYGTRLFIRNPSASIAAILALALGIGGTTAMFSVISAVMLRPLPYEDADRLVSVGTTLRGQPFGPASYADYMFYRAETRAFSELAAYHERDFVLAGFETPLRLKALVVSANLSALLRLKAHAGRLFEPADEAPGQRVVVLSYELWQQRFGGDHGILGRSLRLDGETFEVVGVHAPRMDFPLESQETLLWTTIAVDHATPGSGPSLASQPGVNFLSMIGRLREGATLEQAQAEMSGLASRLERTLPEHHAGRDVRLTFESARLFGPLRPIMFMLIAAVGALLLIACANVASLLLGLSATRRGEIAVRLALGATPSGIASELLVQSLALSAAGGVAGVLLAYWGVRALVNLAPFALVRVREIDLDPGVLAWAVGVSVLTGLAAGLYPALQASRLNLTQAFQDRSGGPSRQSVRSRSSMVAIQIALAMVLLVSAGLLLQALDRLKKTPPGFRSEQLLTDSVRLPATEYNEARQIGFVDQLRSRLRAVPGIVDASVARTLPLSGKYMGTALMLPDRPSSEWPQVDVTAVGPQYFHTMQTGIIKGRDIADTDAMQAPPIALINETLARRLFSGRGALGQYVTPSMSAGDREPAAREIVGIVQDVRYRGLAVEPRPTVYVPYAQLPSPNLWVIVRTHLSEASINAQVRAVMAELDPTLPIDNWQPMDRYLATALAYPRFNSRLFLVFAATALTLTIIGLYGVVSSWVHLRRYELALRLALGARPADLIRMVLGHALWLTAAGLVIGVASYLLVSPVMTYLLYGVTSTDVVTIAVMAVFFLVVAALAALPSALRAAATDSLILLRSR